MNQLEGVRHSSLTAEAVRNGWCTPNAGLLEWKEWQKVHSGEALLPIRSPYIKLGFDNAGLIFLNCRASRGWSSRKEPSEDPRLAHVDCVP